MWSVVGIFYQYFYRIKILSIPVCGDGCGAGHQPAHFPRPHLHSFNAFTSHWTGRQGKIIIKTKNTTPSEVKYLGVYLNWVLYIFITFGAAPLIPRLNLKSTLNSKFNQQWIFRLHPEPLVYTSSKLVLIHFL